MSEKERTPQANIAPFGLRMQPELKVKVEDAARSNERSMNAEIVARLDDSFSLDEASDFPGFTSADKAQLLHAELSKAKVDLDERLHQIGALTEHIRNQREQTERLQEQYTAYRHETARELAIARSEALPESLRKRIDRRAAETGRTFREEIVLALEKAFPPAAETDQMIEILGGLIGDHPAATATLAGDAIRQYLEYLVEERAAGRAEGARARLSEVFTKTSDGRTIRVK